MNVQNLIAINQHRWESMHIKAARLPEFKVIASKICANKTRYGYIEATTGVPWWAVGTIHYREADLNFNSQLGQGDPLNEVSRNVPKRRGPFFNHPTDAPGHDAFYRGALDALIDCPPKAAAWPNWTAGGTMTIFEEYNGLGPEMHGVASGYVWSGTDQYTGGKYIRDGVWDPRYIDIQDGCAPIVAMIIAMDDTVKFPGVRI